MYCPNCATELVSGEESCEACGTPVSVASTLPSQAGSPTGTESASKPQSGTSGLARLLVIDNGGEIFDDISGFNWGAAMFSWIWALAHAQWKLAVAFLGVTFVLAAVPPLDFVWVVLCALGFGAFGNHLAAVGASRGTWSSFAELKAAERPWAVAALIAGAIALVLLILGIMVSAATVGLSFLGGF